MPSIPAPLPRRWRGICPVRTSPHLRKLAVDSSARAANRPTASLTSPLPEQGAATQVWAAVSPELADRGALYLEDCGVSEAVAPYARDEQRAADFWQTLRKGVWQHVSRLERRKQEMREKILMAAFDLFLAQGVAATTIEEICERADVANRTFFNHFATRAGHDPRTGRAAAGQPARRRLRPRRRTDPGAAGRGVRRHRRDAGQIRRHLPRADRRDAGHQRLRHPARIQPARNVRRAHQRRRLPRRGQARHDPDTLADIIVGALSGGIVNWTVDRTYSLETNLHNLGVALADLLKA